MILRQFCARHGRTSLARSSISQCTRFATSVAEGGRSLQPSVGEILPQTSIPGHPDEPSSLLDQTGLPPTPSTRAIRKELDSISQSIKASQLELNAYTSAATGGVSADPNMLSSRGETTPNLWASARNLKKYNQQRHRRSLENGTGSSLVGVYKPTALISNPPTPEMLTLPDLLANQTHLGHHTSLWNPGNSAYIFGKRAGIHIISLDQTYAYLQRASKVIRNVAYHGGLILFVGTRDGFTQIVTEAAKRAKGYHIFDRWVPGTLTNGQQLLAGCALEVVDVNDNPIPTYDPLLDQGSHSVVRPDLVVCLNPLENEVCLHECGLNGVPTIGIIDTDANPSWVTYPVPANDDSLRSVALIAGVLSQAAQQGQQARLQEARSRGRATYNTRAVEEWLEKAQELASIDLDGDQSGGREDVDEEEGESKSRSKVKR